jgi:hypothetical protein
MSLGGCGGKPTFDVTGKVTYNGKPLAKPNGKIVFVGPGGEQAAADIGQDGSYSASKVAAGQNKVAVFYSNPNFQKPTRPPPGSKTPPKSSPAYLTPEDYASPETSKLTVEVKQGTTYNPELSGPAIP